MNSRKSADPKTTTYTDDGSAKPGELPLFEPYESPAGGWGALQATARALREQSVVLKGGKTLLSMNQPDGFDCPGCAWPDPKHTSSFEFCENGAKAVAFELTSRRVTRDRSPTTDRGAWSAASRHGPMPSPGVRSAPTIRKPIHCFRWHTTMPRAKPRRRNRSRLWSGRNEMQRTSRSRPLERNRQS
jgi:hypothetical protein